MEQIAEKKPEIQATTRFQPCLLPKSRRYYQLSYSAKFLSKVYL